MNRQELETALKRLGEILRQRRVAGEIAIFGGAALVLGFDFREGTKDVDAVVLSGHGQVLGAQEEVGRELNLPPNWLNEQAMSYLSKVRDFSPFRTYPSEGQFGLRVYMASSRYILAMKLLALRLYEHDVRDAVQLARRLRLTTEDELLQLIRYYYPEERVPLEKLEAMRDIVRQINAPD